MDVLTSAASAHEVASKSDADSPRGSPAQYEAQILALKRKLIECDRSLNSAHERISGLEKALDMEKREHQLTIPMNFNSNFHQHRREHAIKRRGDDPSGGGGGGGGKGGTQGGHGGARNMSSDSQAYGRYMAKVRNERRN